MGHSSALSSSVAVLSLRRRLPDLGQPWVWIWAQGQRHAPRSNVVLDRSAVVAPLQIFPSRKRATKPPLNGAAPEHPCIEVMFDVWRTVNERDRLTAILPRLPDRERRQLKSGPLRIAVQVDLRVVYLSHHDPRNGGGGGSPGRGRNWRAREVHFTCGKTDAARRLAAPGISTAAKVHVAAANSRGAHPWSLSCDANRVSTVRRRLAVSNARDIAPCAQGRRVKHTGLRSVGPSGFEETASDDFAKARRQLIKCIGHGYSGPRLPQLPKVVLSWVL